MDLGKVLVLSDVHSVLLAQYPLSILVVDDLLDWKDESRKQGLEVSGLSTIPGW